MRAQKWVSVQERSPSQSVSRLQEKAKMRLRSRRQPASGVASRLDSCVGANAAAGNVSSHQWVRSLFIFYFILLLIYLFFLRISGSRGTLGVSGGTYADRQFRASLRPLCSAGPRGQRTRLRCFCSPMCTGRSWLSGSAAQKRHNLNSAAQHLSDVRGWAAKKKKRKKEKEKKKKEGKD